MTIRRHRTTAFLLTIALPVAATTAGCAMCCGPYDYHYPTYGGRIQRVDPEYGRVGSVFSDPNLAGTGPVADSNLVTATRELPPEVDSKGTEVPAVETGPMSRGQLPPPSEDKTTLPSGNPEANPQANPPGTASPLLNPPAEGGGGATSMAPSAANQQSRNQWRSSAPRGNTTGFR